MGTLRLISHGSERFKDRAEAGRMLADYLTEFKGKNAVVVGIPRGGVVVARELARALDAELDVVLARKLRTPGHWELAMGSVAEDGKIFLNQSVVQELSISSAAIEQERQLQLAEIGRRATLMRKVHPKIPLKGRIVIATDDGVATGATTQAALWSLRQEHPEKLIAAIPVGSPESVTRLSADVDEMLCLRAPPLFFAVGQFYVNFQPVEDDDVLAILKEEQEQKVGSNK
ncbi:MAG: phosphoribosyltransferase [Chloroflexi bacterium]|nr:phosphoribosyltransferase [Chloroflexota bacterium]